MKKSHIYTRGGDCGATSLIGGSRVKKCDARLEAYGTIDELSAHIGLLAAMVRPSRADDMELFEWVQSRLFDVGAHLATPCADGQEVPCSIFAVHVQRLEDSIDLFDSQLPALRAFILPGGSVASAQGHVCRTVCRRAERLIIALAESTPISPCLMSFINRLSDFLFVYARFLNKMEGVGEISWQKDCD